MPVLTAQCRVNWFSFDGTDLFSMSHNEHMLLHVFLSAVWRSCQMWWHFFDVFVLSVYIIAGRGIKCSPDGSTGGCSRLAWWCWAHIPNIGSHTKVYASSTCNKIYRYMYIVINIWIYICIMLCIVYFHTSAICNDIDFMWDVHKYMYQISKTKWNADRQVVVCATYNDLRCFTHLQEADAYTVRI